MANSKIAEVIAKLDSIQIMECKENYFLDDSPMHCTEPSGRVFALNIRESTIQVEPCMKHVDYYMRTKFWVEI